MTRNLFYACVLVSGAVLATGWALAPGCEGSFCLGNSYKTEADRNRAGTTEVPGAGRALLGETAQEPAAAAASDDWFSIEETADPSGEAALLEELGEAAEPPEEWRATGDASPDGGVDTIGEPELTPAQRRARHVAEEKAAKRWDSLVEAALKEPDDELRGEAINGVALHRSSESVAVLNEVAALDPSPDNRLQAVQQLWYSAADGLDSDGSIESTLRAALDDPDEAIAKMAEKALADLKALEESRQGN